MLPVIRRRPSVPPPRLQMLTVVAPIGGDDTVSAGLAMPPSHCNFSYNLIGAELGLRSRLGWREWCTGLGTPAEQVRSLLPYTGATSSANRLFACTTSGIWDVTSSSTTPTRVVNFATQNTDSGWGISTVFVNSAGHFLVYTDEANGLYVYQESGGTWTAGGLPANPVTGVTPSNLVSVLAWKNRLWFVEKDSTRGWYLGLGAVTGAATSFTFGQRFQRGGDLRTLASWSLDGATGADDRLVAVSGGGDVVVYAGTDPTYAATFGLQGVAFAGSVPAGRRLTTDSGGELLVMSSLGILPLSRLMNGSVLYDRTQYQTAPIANLFNQLHAATSNQRGWCMRTHPQDSALMVLYPVASGQPTQQLVMSLITKGWHRYRDMPMGVCAEPWGGLLYFGTEDGRVCINDGYLDGVLLSNPNSYSTINWSLLTAFANLGRPTRKRVSQVRVKILSQGGNIPMSAEARYNFDLSEAAAPGVATPSAGAALWDVGLWDVGVWGGAYQVQTQIYGTYGSGTEVALAIRGSASSRMTLLGADVFYDEGGPL